MKARFMISSAAVAVALLAIHSGILAFGPTPSATNMAIAAPAGSEKVVFAGGCFWGMEAVFESLKGVSSVVSGYAGGSKASAHYDIVSTGATGHAESVEITFDPSQISFEQLLKVDFTVAHDPTEINRQGPDEGSQYRSVIFYTTQAQKQSAQAYIQKMDEAKMFRDRIVTEVVPLQAFYPAEPYHQHFVTRNPNYPYVVYNDIPKLQRLRERFPALVKNAAK